jgi:hypothetical protein
MTTPPIACSLTATDLSARLGAWQEVLTHVVDRAPIDDGLRLVLGPTAPIGDIARLAAAEHACCAFFSFAVTIDARGAALEVSAPADASEILTALFG